MAGFLFRLELEGGIPADPPMFETGGQCGGLFSGSDLPARRPDPESLELLNRILGPFTVVIVHFYGEVGFERVLVADLLPDPRLVRYLCETPNEFLACDFVRHGSGILVGGSGCPKRPLGRPSGGA
jgi:hypothetical protein